MTTKKSRVFDAIQSKYSNQPIARKLIIQEVMNINYPETEFDRTWRGYYSSAFATRRGMWSYNPNNGYFLRPSHYDSRYLERVSKGVYKLIY
jgi:hypothetical protein